MLNTIIQNYLYYLVVTFWYTVVLFVYKTSATFFPLFMLSLRETFRFIDDRINAMWSLF